MRQHRAGVRRAVLADLERGGEGRAEQGERLVEDLRELHRLPAPLTRATERQDLLDQVFGTVAGQAHTLEVAAGRMRGRQPSERQLREAEDYLQNIIKFMRNAA